MVARVLSPPHPQALEALCPAGEGAQGWFCSAEQPCDFGKLSIPSSLTQVIFQNQGVRLGSLALKLELFYGVEGYT